MAIYRRVPPHQAFAEAHRAGRVNVQRSADGLLVYKYNTSTVYNRDWDAVTLHARGIVFDATNEHRLIALPFAKFFNLGELEGPRGQVPPQGFAGVEVLDKLDGSMGCVFLDGTGELRVSTPGSAESPQARWATEWLRASHAATATRDLLASGACRCLVTEIIYEGSRVVLDYDEVGLRVIAAQLPAGGDWRYATHAELVALGLHVGLGVVERLPINDERELRARMMRDADYEGVVLHWPETGFRLKAKTAWYIHRHRLISLVHPNRVVEAMHEVSHAGAHYADLAAAARACVAEFPEEHRPPYDAALASLDAEHDAFMARLDAAVEWLSASVSAGPDFQRECAGLLRAGEVPGVSPREIGFVMRVSRGERRLPVKLVVDLWRAACADAGI